ncbi:protein Daple-like isoform X2 [Dreissena polymorpha]|uniref:protein Daple-like isoform X2 n=1 Tax=Dreissena polymorpha TaxID=45954 RepID=UPI00226437CD|nr:protein Daple-like isoform X2 [Dreissena polymorpha]
MKTCFFFQTVKFTKARQLNSVSKKVHTTKKNTNSVFTVDNTQIIFVDTPGVITDAAKRRHQVDTSVQKEPESSLEEADLVGVVVDGSNKFTRNTLHPEIIKTLLLYRNVPSFLIINKVDEVSQKYVLLEAARLLTGGLIGGKKFSTSSYTKKKEISLESFKKHPPKMFSFLESKYGKLDAKHAQSGKTLDAVSKGVNQEKEEVDKLFNIRNVMENEEKLRKDGQRMTEILSEVSKKSLTRLTNQRPATLKDLQNQRPATVKDLQNQKPATLKDLQNQRPACLKDLQNQRPATLRDLPNQQPATLRDLPNQHPATLKDLQNQRPATLKDLQNQMPATLKDLQNQRPATLQDLQNQRPATLKDLANQQPATLRDLPNQHQATLKDLQNQRPATLKDLQNQMPATLKDLPNQQPATLKDLSNQQPATLKNLPNQQQATLIDLRDQGPATLKDLHNQQPDTLKGLCRGDNLSQNNVDSMKTLTYDYETFSTAVEINEETRDNLFQNDAMSIETLTADYETFAKPVETNEETWKTCDNIENNLLSRLNKLKMLQSNEELMFEYTTEDGGYEIKHAGIDSKSNVEVISTDKEFDQWNTNIIEKLEQENVDTTPEGLVKESAENGLVVQDKSYQSDFLTQLFSIRYKEYSIPRRSDKDREEEEWRKKVAEATKAAKDMTKWPHFERVFITSSVSGIGIDDVKEYLLEQAKPADWQFHSSVVTEQHPYEIALLVTRQALLDHIAGWVPYKLQPVISYWDVHDDNSLHVSIDLNVSCKEHMRQIIGNNSETIRAISYDTKQALMDAFHCEVKLRLCINVKKRRGSRQ